MNVIGTAYIMIMDVSINLKKILEWIWYIFIHTVIHENSSNVSIYISHIQYSINYTKGFCICALYGEHVIILISFFWTKYSFSRFVG